MVALPAGVVGPRGRNRIGFGGACVMLQACGHVNSAVAGSD